jgi:outer membrane autotransporter protein
MNGNYQQTAGGVYATDVADLTNGYGKLFINGNVTFSSGASLRVNKLAGISLSNGVVLQSVISATGSWTGPLPTVVDNSYLFNFVAERTRDPAAMDLRVVVGNTVEDAVRSNGNNPSIPLAKVLDGYVSSMPPTPGMQKVIDALDSLGSSREVSNAVAQMQPLFFGATTEIIHDLTRISLEAAHNRCDAVGGPSVAVTTEGSKCAWITPFGTTGSQSARNGALGVHRNSSGLRGGLEGDVNGSIRAGLTFAGLDSQIASDDSRAVQSASIASYVVGGFGDWQLGDGAHVVASGAVNYNEMRGRRNFDIGGLSGFADSKFDGWAYHLSTEIAKKWNLSNQTSLKITDGVRYSEWSTSGYRESGATVLNLAVSEQKKSALILSVNLEATHQLDEQWKIVSMLGAQVDALNRGVDSYAKFAQGDGFSTAAAAPSAKTLQAGFGLQLRQSKSTRVATQYFLESRESGYLNQGLALDINVQY